MLIIAEYSAAIDFYENKFVHLQRICCTLISKRRDAQKRLQELIDATERATEVELEHIFIKQRKEQKRTKSIRKSLAPKESFT